MLDFVAIRTSTKSQGRKGAEELTITVYPEFLVGPSDDLMVRGGGFYAVWDEKKGFWTKDPGFVREAVDEALRARRDEFPDDSTVEVKYLRDFSTKKWSEFLAYVGSLPDNFHELDSQLTFLDDQVQKHDYVSKRLPYPLKACETKAYDELMGTLYDPIERQKIEWAIGSVIYGDSRWIQKFLVLYGAAGTGKSTVLSIIQQLFQGYYNVFESKALANSSNQFALESFRNNPLVSIQHDGDLSRIEDNTKLNSVVSHEEMVVNEKHKATYAATFNSFVFMGTNRPVQITDGKSGIGRRLIDVEPSGNTVSFDRYQILMAQIKFELGGIAKHCYEVYSELGPDAYEDYRPTRMMGATNDFYNFVEDHYDIFKKEGGVTLAQAWAMYKRWSEDSAVRYPLSKRGVKEELKSYFKGFKERTKNSDGEYLRNLYYGFQSDKFAYSSERGLAQPKVPSSGLVLDSKISIFDKKCADCPAQPATKSGTPSLKWSDVKTTLKDINTSDLHYVQVPDNHIVIDFDIPGEDGEKNLDKNLRAASKWPSTYAELSKSGQGIHLHYIYDGDVEELARNYDDHIEIKVFTGNSALRRKLTRCNDIPIATIGSGLPKKKGGKDVINFEGLKNEKALRTVIKKNLNKEIHPGTKPSVDFIYKILNDAYSSGMPYDVTDLRPAIMAFANNSTNHALYCINLVNEMPFHSEQSSESVDAEESGIIFYDVEVFPNLFVVVWKREGSDIPVKMINPTPLEIEELMKFNLVGFNCRRYDNHILYARLMSYTNEQLYNLSKKIIEGSQNAMFREAYNISYTDIYDYAATKQSLKKWEIQLGVHHQELGLPWDQPVPENLWDKVAEYCINDVIATEATFHATADDFVARKILAQLSGLSLNDTTRMHMTKIIFGNDRTPQNKFIYTDLSEMFEGYTFDNGKSMYRGEEVGEGGYVYAEPGVYSDVALLDVRSMHPTSLLELNLFGPYTEKFRELVDIRVAVKQGDHKAVKKAFGGALSEIIDDPDISDKSLAYALKIGINSVYGYTKASFDCEFRDPRNIDNIVAKRGALFMIDLKHAVQEQGFTVAHIKTDSIKIPEATPEIIQFVEEYGKKYGYIFEHEDTYKKFALVNDAVYIARKESGDWTATGTQFAVPYVFKTLFSKEEIEFADLCEIKTVTKGAIYLDFNEDLDDGKHNYHFVGRAGAFCPIKDGCGGGVLLRSEDEEKYVAVVGSKGYRWMESEVVRNLGREGDVDTGYYDEKVTEAIKTIEKFDSFDNFVKE